MTRYLLIGLSVMVIACGIHAQFSVPQQPIFANASSAQEYATNLAHRWVATDLSNNVRIAQWQDRITTNFPLGSYANHNISNTSQGVRFTSAGSALTNAYGRDSYFINWASQTSTNQAVGIIFKFEFTDENFRAFITASTGFPGGGIDYRTTTGDNGDRYLLAPNGFNLWPTPSVFSTPVTNWLSVVFASTNNTVPQNLGVVFLNGTLSTNFAGPASGLIAQKVVGLWDFGAGGVTTDAFGFRGYIKEIWIRTNALAGDGLAGMASDLHYVKTNIYGLPNN